MLTEAVHTLRMLEAVAEAHWGGPLTTERLLKLAMKRTECEWRIVTRIRGVIRRDGRDMVEMVSSHVMTRQFAEGQLWRMQQNYPGLDLSIELDLDEARRISLSPMATSSSST